MIYRLIMIVIGALTGATMMSIRFVEVMEINNLAPTNAMGMPMTNLGPAQIVFMLMLVSICIVMVLTEPPNKKKEKNGNNKRT